MSVTIKAYADRMGATAATDYIGRPGDIFWDQTNGALRVSDGATAGGTLIGGGGEVGLDNLTDVDILNVENNDLLMYNSVASKWQNTNLGVTVTPILTGSATTIGTLGYTITVSNHATYDNPAYFVEVYNGSTLVVADSAITNNHDGTLSFIAPTADTYEVRVTCQDFGDLQSEVATKALTTTPFGGTFRYWRVMDAIAPNDGGYTNGSNRWALNELRLYSEEAQTGTPYPPNMTSATAPTPYVVSSNYSFSNSYVDWKAFDSSTSSSYWTLGSGALKFSVYLQIDLGSPIEIKSVTTLGMNVKDYQVGEFKLYGSNTGAFSGEETLVLHAEGLDVSARDIRNNFG
jgi:hypothetical protein